MKGTNKQSLSKASQYFSAHRLAVGLMVFLISSVWVCAQSTIRKASTSRTTTQPNIIVFLVDDMGWQDTSVPFWRQTTPLNRRYHTPAMERMAREGVKFTNAYAMPVCTPTRVSLLTGMNATHHRVTHWTSPDKNTNTDYADTTLHSVAWNINGLSAEAGVARTVYATPLPALLSQANYYTIHCGKAHFGSAGTPGADPRNLGFRVNIAGNEIGHPASYLGTDHYDRPVNGKPNRNAVSDLAAYHDTDTFLSEALTLEALKALEEPIRSKRPFFLYLSHYAVHTPIMADKRFVDRYLKAGLDSLEAKYASLVEGMDKSLGDVMQFLDERRLANNTVILFMSDNGGLSVSPLRSPPAHTQNLPLRAGKSSVYEGGIREPMLVRWPGVIRPGSVANQYVTVEDFFPTILEIAGVRQPKLVQEVDGRTFIPILKKPGLTDSTRMLVWHHPNRWIPQEGPAISWASAFRKGDWKLVYQHRTESLELYNLNADIGEQTDLAAVHPQKVRELATLFTEQLKKWDAQMPIFKRTGKPVRWPQDAIPLRPH